MAITDAYATLDEYKAQYHEGPDADNVIKRQLLTVSRLFERETGQFFTKDASVVNRVFKARYSDLLDLTYEGNCPGIASTSGLVIKVDTDNDGSFSDETAWASTDYELLPRGALQGSEQKPYTEIAVPSWGTQSFSIGSLVQVTAIFGWPSVPQAVKDDVIELTAIWRGESPRATGRMNELDQIVSQSPMAMSLVSRIRDAYRGTVAL